MKSFCSGGAGEIEKEGNAISKIEKEGHAAGHPIVQKSANAMGAAVGPIGRGKEPPPN
jgi:hypothetical protein